MNLDSDFYIFRPIFRSKGTKRELTSSKRKNPAKLNKIIVRSLTTNKSLLPKCKTDQYRNGNEVLIAKGETIACPFSMFIRYVELSGMNLDSDFYIFRPIFRSKGTCKLIYKNEYSHSIFTSLHKKRTDFIKT
jgi:hypothetical protein